MPDGDDSPARGDARRACVRVKLGEDEGAALVRRGDSWQQDDEHKRPHNVPHGGGAIPERQEARRQEVDESVQEQNDCSTNSRSAPCYLMIMLIACLGKPY